MNNIKKVVLPVKGFVIRHKTAVLVTATAVVLIAVNKRTVDVHDDFLRQNNLYDKFYNTEG